jgi:MoaA/NifB/PqqE/SkfB family radical SAM enzyme
MKNSFCPSPWFHNEVMNDGAFKECRWGKAQYNPQTINKQENISTMSLMQFHNSESMRQLRLDFLAGKKPDICVECYYQDSMGKLSPRKRQLLKAGILIDDFDLTMRASPMWDDFQYSADNAGATLMRPVDLQIDLGNVCNSACVMCSPAFSSKLVPEYKKLIKIEPEIFSFTPVARNWDLDPVNVKNLIDEMLDTDNIRYIHLLGGEPLFNETFYTICNALISAGKAKDIIMGTTTNGTLYDARIENVIKEFKEFHLGLSIETVTPMNDYFRYPGKIADIIGNVHRFLDLREHSNLQISLRITPNLFTAYDFDSLFDFMVENRVIAESCNILTDPRHLRMEILPDDIRNEITEKLRTTVNKYNFKKTDTVNIRNKHFMDGVIATIAVEYLEFFEKFTAPVDVEESRRDLVKALRAFEISRGNSILDYAPRYEEFLRSYGY